MTLSFEEKLIHRIDEIQSILCIGLDPHENEIFPLGDGIHTKTDDERCEAAYIFCKNIIEHTKHVTVCYKPNIAFFESLSYINGIYTLHRVLQLIPTNIPILLDCKRGDIGTTASSYAKACYDTIPGSSDSVVDAVTLSPFMGYDSIEPFKP